MHIPTHPFYFRWGLALTKLFGAVETSIKFDTWHFTENQTFVPLSTTHLPISRKSLPTSVRGDPQQSVDAGSKVCR